ncbi:hypothetical protein jhhlp_007346 [Lomentospora prolificans]|uniref:Trimethylguanosine synthase n=1 Tax=Lomentospora prolificans TaxID=41688 RepID=A0A2N3N2E0_9PEZI|nr:hypothetical protein jhhlp_007346 [Lomentospora prolificans]
MGNNQSFNDHRKTSTEYMMKPADELILTDNCRHYEKKQDVPWDLQKYWSQRYTLFEAYDDGVHLTDDAWFGVTPEPVAQQIAYELAGASGTKTTIIDLFAGAGGNSIQFALSERWERVIAIEKDRDTLACAQHNAKIYEITNEITWVLGDSFEYLKLALEQPDQLHEALRIDPASTILFASPPWGGPGYRTDEIFNLHKMEPYNLAQLHAAYKSLDYSLYLPRTSDLRQIARLVPDDKKIEVVQYCIEGASKALLACVPAENSPHPTFYFRDD